MGSSVVFVVFLTSQLATCFSTAHEYYCPREELLIGKYCYKNMKSAVMKKDVAEKYCQSLNKELPESTLSQTALSGWLQDTAATRGDVKDNYCVYSYNNPLGIASPDNPLFNIAPCSRKLHVLCSKELPTGSACESGWVEAIRNTYKYCVKSSEYSTAAAAMFSKNICPKESSVFSFNYQDVNEGLTYENVGPDSELFQPFWTPYYVTEDKTVDWFTKSDARQFKACLYKTANLHVTLVSCDIVKQFHCQSLAKEVPHEETVDPDPYDSDKDYSCGKAGEVLCKNKCYRHWTTYMTQSDAANKCTTGGYKLTSQTVPCIQYITGWVNGSFEDGSLSTSSNLPLIVEHCVYVHEGETKLADCRVRTNALYTVQLEEGGEDSCPDSFHQCGDKPLCVGSSLDKLTWSDAVNNAPRDRRRLLATRSMLDDCSVTIKEKLKEPLWVGAGLSKGGVFEFNNGEEITVKSKKQCLKMIGGKLMTGDCNTMMYFTCERLAAMSGKQSTSSSSTMIVVALVVGPLLILGVVLLLLYKKKGKEMCLSRSLAAGVEEADAENGVTLTNPLAETEPEYEVQSKATNADNPYTEVDI